MIDRFRQLAAKIGTVGSFNSAVHAASYANIPLLDGTLRVTFDQKNNERAHQRKTLGMLTHVPGARIGRIKFSTELQGSGAAGTAPAIDAILRACGLVKTANTGSASVGTVTYRPSEIIDSASGGIDQVGPQIAAGTTIAGTFNDSLSGYYEIRFVSYSSPNLVLRWVFYKSDETVESGTATVDLTSGPPTTAVSIGNDLTISFTETAADLADLLGLGDTGFAMNLRFNVVSASQLDTTYSPKNVTPDSMEFADLAVYKDGTLFDFHSCQGSITNGGWANIGETGRLDFDFYGIFEAKADAALLTSIAYQNVAPPAFKGITFTLGGDTIPCFNSFTFALNNNVAGRECAYSTTGFNRATIRKRQITGAVDPIASLLATYDAYDDFFNGTAAALNCVVGSTSGNIIQVKGTNVQVVNVDDADRGGESVLPLPLAFGESDYKSDEEYGKEQFQLIFK